MNRDCHIIGQEGTHGAADGHCFAGIIVHRVEQNEEETDRNGMVGHFGVEHPEKGEGKGKREGKRGKSRKRERRIDENWGRTVGYASRTKALRGRSKALTLAI